jgi:hypothetical protein
VLWGCFANRLWALFKSARLIVLDVAQCFSGVCPHWVKLAPIAAIKRWAVCRKNEWVSLGHFWQ